MFDCLRITKQEKEEQALTAEQFCKMLINAFKSKSDHNKNESMRFFWISMGGALLAPLFVTLGTDMATSIGESTTLVFIFSKLIPSILSIAVAFSTAWLQLRKPQQLWALYRTQQRELENCLSKYKFRIVEYDNCQDPDKLLAEQVSKIALNAHYTWLPIVPNPENMSSSSKIEEKAKK